MRGGRRWGFVCLVLVFVLACGGCLGSSVKPAQQGLLSPESEKVHAFGRIRLIEEGRVIVDYTQDDKVYLEFFDIKSESYAGTIEVAEDGTYSMAMPPGEYGVNALHKGSSRYSFDYTVWVKRGFRVGETGKSSYLGTITVLAHDVQDKRLLRGQWRVPGTVAVSDEFVHEGAVLERLGLRKDDVLTKPLFYCPHYTGGFKLGEPWHSILTILEPVLINAHMFVH